MTVADGAFGSILTRQEMVRRGDRFVRDVERWYRATTPKQRKLERARWDRILDSRVTTKTRRRADQKKMIIVEANVSTMSDSSINALIIAMRRAGRKHKIEPVIKMSHR